MERSRNWLAWLALALAGLALLAVLGVGLVATRFITATSAPVAAPAVQAPAAPQASQPPVGPGGRFAERGRGGPPAFFAERPEHHGAGPSLMHGAARHGGHQHGGFWPWHGLGWLGVAFGLLRGLAQLVAIALLAWLLLRLFQQGRGGQPPVSPTTPAGHDPRVE